MGWPCRMPAQHRAEALRHAELARPSGHRRPAVPVPPFPPLPPFASLPAASQPLPADMASLCSPKTPQQGGTAIHRKKITCAALDEDLVARGGQRRHVRRAHCHPIFPRLDLLWHADASGQRHNSPAASASGMRRPKHARRGRTAAEPLRAAYAAAVEQGRHGHCGGGGAAARAAEAVPSRCCAPRVGSVLPERRRRTRKRRSKFEVVQLCVFGVRRVEWMDVFSCAQAQGGGGRACIYIGHVRGEG